MLVNRRSLPESYGQEAHFKTGPFSKADLILKKKKLNICNGQQDLHIEHTVLCKSLKQSNKIKFK